MTFKKFAALMTFPVDVTKMRLSNLTEPLPNTISIFFFWFIRIFLIISFMGISRLLASNLGEVTAYSCACVRDNVLLTWITLFI